MVYLLRRLIENQYPTEGGRVAEEDDIGKLSFELQQLLEAKIESSPEVGQSLGWIRVTALGKHTAILYRLFDTEDNSYKSWKECPMLLGARAKLRLLQAIGSCRTLRKIFVEDLKGNELVALLTPMQSNPVLEDLYIYCDNSIAAESASAAIEYAERICEILGRILQTSRTFNDLRLYLWGVTAAGACHLASGVLANDGSALEAFYMGRWMESSVANQVAKIVQSAPRLRELQVYGGRVIEDDGIDALASALAQTTSLEWLELNDVVKGASALLRKAFTGNGSNKSIAALKLTGVMEGLGDVLSFVLSTNQSLKQLSCDLVHESLSPSQWRSFGRSLSSSSSLELFRIAVDWSYFRGEAIDPGEALLLSALDLTNSCVGLYVNAEWSPVRSRPWLAPSEWRDNETKELLLEVNYTKDLIVELHVFYEHLRDLTTKWASLAEALNSKGINISSLYLDMSLKTPGAEGREVDNFFQALRRSSTLRILTVNRGNRQHWSGGWMKLVECLRSNTSISHLRLIDCEDLNDDVFKGFMGVLQVNLTLKRIRLTGTSWETDGKKALIEEALRRNAEQDSYFSIFRRHGLQFQPATNGRLFLCGSPFAGKTRLRKTMTHTSWFEDAAAELWRTEGIEVEVLKNETKMQIAVWDLAGHWIFRVLQNILFPQTNHTSIFLFVFSPYNREKNCIKKDLAQCFKTELDDWLRFIASNSQIIGQMLPKVLVVISHMDKMQVREFLWPKRIIKELAQEFQNTLDVCENVYQVNACRRKEVKPLKDFILQMFRDLLKDNSPIAPRVCSQISSLLAKRGKHVKHRPLWSSLEFYRFCFDNMQDNIRKSLKPSTTSGLEVFEAMASHLHDTGSIIIISSLDKIIVDPNWLTNVFLGELITMGHNFQVDSKVVQKSKTRLFFSKTGFVSSSDLEFLLSSCRHKCPKFRELDISLLENLLIHFELCYKLRSEEVIEQYFIPTIVCEDIRGFDAGWRTGTERKPLSWSTPLNNNQQFIGFRVECEDPRTTFMTAALYPRFQIYLRQKLMDEMELNDDNVMCFRDYMRLHMDGHEIIVEKSDIYMAKSHIDVMVKCSEHKSREISVKYIEEHIIEELRKFCASPKGCPGIVLVVGVLRTDCVKKLIPLLHRGENQAILIQKLKENFEAYINKHIEGIQTKSLRRSSSSLFNYEHYWPPIPGHLPGSWQLAKELLPESEVESVVRIMLQTHEQSMKLIDPVSSEQTDEVDQTHYVSGVVTKIGKFGLAQEVGDPSSSSPNTTLEDDSEELHNHPKRSNIRRQSWDVIQLTDAVFEIHAPLGDAPLVELVFVHGIAENESDEKSYLTTWSTRNDNDRCWINTWLVSGELKQARVLTLSFDSSIQKTGSKGNMDIFQAAENLTDSLITLAHVGQNNCPVVLVGHSLGGLVIKDICVHASKKRLDKKKHKNFLKNMKGLFFYSTPHMGCSQEFCDMLSLIDASYSSRSQRGNMIESLVMFSKQTSRWNHEFDHLRQLYRWRSGGVCESDKTKNCFLKDTISTADEIVVVEEASARVGSLDLFSVIPGTDHFTICRPASETSDSVLYLVEFVKDFILQE